jgi:NADP-dependent 3-hydroxy acid dehydrogenase YdfG
MKNKIWFITGVSSGFGKAIAETAINKGDFVIGTFRKAEQVESFNRRKNCFAYLLDIRNDAEIESAVNGSIKKFGRIDVLVNNAGSGLAGAIEETSPAETEEIFETNFFGVLKLTQCFLPAFRKQKSGHIIQISSHGGIKAFAGFGIYNAAKFAVEGFSEALAQEIAPLGIKLTIVELGPFRTNFAGDSFKLAGRIIDDYKTTSGVFRERIKGADGKQEGDPIKAAEAIYKLTETDNPPLRQPLGKISIATIRSKIKNIQDDLDRGKSVAESVVCD